MPHKGKKNERDANLPQFHRYQEYRRLFELFPRTTVFLAEAVGVSSKTVARDLRHLKDAWGWELRYDASTRKWRAQGAMPLPLLHLNRPEILALLVSMPALEAYGESPFASALRSAMAKIVVSLDAPVRLDRPSVGFELLSARQVDTHLFQEFAQAARARERLQLTYFSPDTGKTTCRDIDPYGLENHDGAWYVNAYCHLRKGPRDFAISALRVRNIVHTGITFEPDPAVGAHAGSTFGAFKSTETVDVVALFAPSQLVYQTERVLWPGEKREPQPDGALLIRFPAPLKIGLVRWLLQYGREVEVLAPKELREWLFRESSAMARRHRDASSRRDGANSSKAG